VSFLPFGNPSSFDPAHQGYKFFIVNAGNTDEFFHCQVVVRECDNYTHLSLIPEYITMVLCNVCQLGLDIVVDLLEVIEELVMRSDHTGKHCD